MSDIAHRVRAFNKDRIPTFTALKYQAMAENAFRFFRGTCHLFYQDLDNKALPHSPRVWVCGDLHLENFGSYKGDNRLVYFDVNDFDEATLAPASWELTRMIASIVTGFDALGVRKKETHQAVNRFLSTYATTLAKGKARYLEPRTADGIVRIFLDQVSERRQKDLVRQRTYLKDEKLRLKIDLLRLFPLDKSLRKQLMSHVQTWLDRQPRLYNHFRVLDAAARVAGTGSLGLKRYCFLVRSGDDPKKHLLIDMKQAAPSCLTPYTPCPQPTWESEADRVVAVQERMQNISPALLSTTRFGDDDFVLKELQPIADKIDFRLMRDRPGDIECVICDMALLTASAQLRSAARQSAEGPDELIEFGKDISWHKGLLDYAAHCAESIPGQYQEYFNQFKAGFFES